MHVSKFKKKFFNRFVAEVERFEKTVEGLCKHSLSGPTPLEREWKVFEGIYIYVHHV